LFQFDPGRKTFSALSERNTHRNVLGLLKDGRVCLARLASETAHVNAPYLEIYDGSRFESFPDPPTDPLLANNLLSFFTAQNGDFWLGGERGTALYHDKKWRVFSSNDKSTPESVLCFAEIADGKIWCATSDKVWEFDGRNWSAVKRGCTAFVQSFLTPDE